MAQTASSERSESWRDLIAACEFARDRFGQWGRDGKLDGQTAGALAELYAKRRDEYGDLADRQAAPPPDVDLPPLESTSPGNEAAARALRFWKFLSNEMRSLEESGRLPLADSHACMAEAHERINFLRRRLERPGAPSAATPPPYPLAPEMPDVAHR